MRTFKRVHKSRHGEIYIKSFYKVLKTFILFINKVNKTKAIKKIRIKRRVYSVIQKILVVNLAKETKDLRRLSNLV